MIGSEKKPGVATTRPGPWSTLVEVNVKTVAERFFAKVDKNGPVPAHRPELGQCWIWTGYRETTSSGSRGMVTANSRRERSHRAAWRLAHGSIPDGLWVLHRCDNPLCVRASHLFLGTAKTNVADMISKGRHCHGSRVAWAKLDEADVIEIRRLRALGGRLAPIAARFGVSESLICMVCRRYHWKHVA